MAVGDYPRDPSVKRGHPTATGAPPEGHMRRCQARSRVTRKQCGKWALKGQNCCQWHGGKYPLRKRLANLYSRRAQGKFRSLMEELAGQADERLSLAEEVDATRAVAAEAMELFAASMESDKPETKGIAATVAKDALKAVAEMVEKMARVNILAPQAMEAQQVDFVLGTVAKILERHLAKNPKLLAGIVEEIEGIALPQKTGPKMTISLTA